MSIKECIDKSIALKRPLVLYSKPNENIVRGYLQSSDEIHFYNQQEGFIFAPFHVKRGTYIIPFSDAKTLEFEMPDIEEMDSHIEKAAGSKEAHVDLVTKTIQKISTSEISKIVVSRIEEVLLNQVDLDLLFIKLLAQYANAFVYIWIHPKTGIWMGATPERLLQVKNNEFEVMALAATQKYGDSLDVSWGDKEKEEHQFVVDYIKEILKGFDFKVSDTYTTKAGSLLHLRADISGKLTKNVAIDSLIETLHPTPATCGTPKKEAKAFIIKEEGYDRSYYTGYLGELSKNHADLYVNLRCMQINPKTKSVQIYIGGGVTENSKPEAEWNETVAKAAIIKKVL